MKTDKTAEQRQMESAGRQAIHEYLSGIGRKGGFAGKGVSRFKADKEKASRDARLAAFKRWGKTDSAEKPIDTEGDTTI